MSLVRASFSKCSSSMCKSLMKFLCAFEPLKNMILLTKQLADCSCGSAIYWWECTGLSQWTSMAGSRMCNWWECRYMCVDTQRHNVHNVLTAEFQELVDTVSGPSAG
ncbi:hypothetical protein M758_9G098100 [Ceratodon purpureus]|nr:hypothetical protein M758_9G098100 [Ceratodon purpureus]